jgi:hypothetical protein
VQPREATPVLQANRAARGPDPERKRLLSIDRHDDRGAVGREGRLGDALEAPSEAHGPRCGSIGRHRLLELQHELFPLVHDNGERRYTARRISAGGLIEDDGALALRLYRERPSDQRAIGLRAALRLGLSFDVRLRWHGYDREREGKSATHARAHRYSSTWVRPLSSKARCAWPRCPARTAIIVTLDLAQRPAVPEAVRMDALLDAGLNFEQSG